MRSPWRGGNSSCTGDSPRPDRPRQRRLADSPQWRWGHCARPAGTAPGVPRRPRRRGKRRWECPHDLDMLAVGVGLQAAPLLVEFELHVLLELYVKVQLPVVMLQRKAPVHPDVLRPGAERLVVEEGFQRHEQGVVVQPPAVVPDEVLIVRVCAYAAALIGLAQQGKAVLVELVKVHLGGVVAEAHAVAFLPGQHPLLHQRVQTDEIRVSRKGGIRLIRRIVGAAIAGSPQRQNLPVALTGLLQPVHEIIGRLVKTADAVFGRQAGNGQQYTCVSFHFLWLLASICP